MYPPKSEFEPDSTYDDDPSESLVVSYSPDADGTGGMTLAAATGGFAGNSAAWFDTSSVIEFVESLSGFPLPEKSSFTISSGFGANEQNGWAAQEHVGISVEPVGNRGQVRLRVHLASPVWQAEPVTVPHHDVHLDFLTTYERLRRFGMHLGMVRRGELPVAALRTEVLGQGVRLR